jgi:hypothetical protein
METLEKTKDYARFKYINGNRDISERHVRRLMRSMKEEQLVSFVIINKHDEIIDGQNRFEACKRLDLPVYVYRDGKTAKYGLNQVQRYNSNTMVWNKRSYLNSYCALGVKPYLQLQEFMKNYPDFGVAVAISIIVNKPFILKGRGVREDGLVVSKPFEEGQLSIDDLGLAYENAGKIMAYKPFYSGFNRRSFVASMLQMFTNKRFDHEVMLRKLEICPEQLRHCHTVNQYKTIIEDIYNYKNRDKVNLRF